MTSVSHEAIGEAQNGLSASRKAGKICNSQPYLVTLEQKIFAVPHNDLYTASSQRIALCSVGPFSLAPASRRLGRLAEALCSAACRNSRSRPLDLRSLLRLTYLLSMDVYLSRIRLNEGFSGSLTKAGNRKRPLRPFPALLLFKAQLSTYSIECCRLPQILPIHTL